MTEFCEGFASETTGPVNNMRTMNPATKAVNLPFNRFLERVWEGVEIIVAPYVLRSGPSAERQELLQKRGMHAVVLNIGFKCAKNAFQPMSDLNWAAAPVNFG
jgi:hypothetical protein